MLPVLDISDYLADPAGDKAQQFVEQLLDTLHGPGFFYLVGHGVDKETDHAVIEIANRFFELPLKSVRRWRSVIHRIFVVTRYWKVKEPVAKLTGGIKLILGLKNRHRY